MTKVTALIGVGNEEFWYSYLDGAMLTLIRKLTEKSLLLLYVILGGMFLYAMLSEEDCDDVGNVEYDSCVIIKEEN